MAQFTFVTERGREEPRNTACLGQPGVRRVCRHFSLACRPGLAGLKFSAFQAESRPTRGHQRKPLARSAQRHYCLPQIQVQRLNEE
jgi:hypothetical protein